jgi:phosphoribosylanthranilate isomerase
MVAAEAGADALGFIFHEPSPRAISLESAASITRQLPPHIAKVGVFVNAPEDFVQQALRECGLTILQFHGEEPSDFCLQFGVMSMKAVRVRDQSSLAALESYHTDAFLLDTYSSGKPGGTGECFDWSLAAQARVYGRPIFLAGGLSPENVSQAIEQAQPYGVDVSSGVEARPGVKDHEKVRAFVKNAKAAAA